MSGDMETDGTEMAAPISDHDSLSSPPPSSSGVVAIPEERQQSEKSSSQSDTGSNVTLIQSKSVEIFHELEVDEGETWSEAVVYRDQWSVDTGEPLKATITHTRQMSGGQRVVRQETRDASGRLLDVKTDVGDKELADFDRQWSSQWKPRLHNQILHEYEEETLASARRHQRNLKPHWNKGLPSLTSQSSVE